MPTFEFPMPGGGTKRAIGNTAQEAWENLNSGLAPEPATPEERKRDREGQMRIGDATDALKGVMQGWLDPIEGLTQLAEKSTGWKLAPEGLRDWARDYRKRVQGTYLGQAGEIGGSIFNPAMLIPGGAAVRTIPWLQRAAAGALGGAMQPVTGGGDYWRTKWNQAVAGGLGGATLPAVAAAAARAPTYLSSHMPQWLWHASGASALPAAAGGAAARVAPGATGMAIGEVQGQFPAEEE